MAVAVPRYLLGNNEVPARFLCGARRPILSAIAGAVAVAWLYARQQVEVVLSFCAWRDGQHLWLSPSPDISLAIAKSPRGF